MFPSGIGIEPGLRWGWKAAVNHFFPICHFYNIYKTKNKDFCYFPKITLSIKSFLTQKKCTIYANIKLLFDKPFLQINLYNQ